MDEGFKKQAREWFERGRHDIETAQILYEQRGYTDTIAYHVQQALEKHLKGYLVWHGKRPPRPHELDTLLDQVTTIDDRLSEYLDLCEKATRFYVEDRYPPGPPVEYSPEEIREDLESRHEGSQAHYPGSRP